MTKKSRGKKKLRAQRGLTRVELAKHFAIGLTSVDRLIAFGLRPIGRRGRANLYDSTAARRLSERLAPAAMVAADVLIADYRSAAEDLHDRRQWELHAWIADALWWPAWRHLVELVGRITADWPRRLAERVGKLSPQEAQLLSWADGPRVLPPPPATECAAAESILRQLLAEADGWPRLEADVLAASASLNVSDYLLRRTALHLGITMQDGRWHRPADGRRAWLEEETQEAIRQLDAAEAERRYPAPLIRPLLESLVQVLNTSPAVGELMTVLEPPDPEPLPPPPASVDVARAQWRAARSAYRRVRVMVRRGHRRRGELEAQLLRSVRQFRAAWWQARSRFASVTGNQDAARAFADRIRREALVQLASLGGTAAA